MSIALSDITVQRLGKETRSHTGCYLQGHAVPSVKMEDRVDFDHGGCQRREREGEKEGRAAERGDATRKGIWEHGKVAGF